jgi:hypothetical protein
MLVKGFILLLSSSMSFPYGFKESEQLFDTHEECFEYYDSFNDWVPFGGDHVFGNLYSSRGKIKLFTTPIGLAYVTCQEIKND